MSDKSIHQAPASSTLPGHSTTPIQAASFEDALTLATIIVNPETYHGYRVNAFEASQNTLLVIDEETGDHLALSVEDVRGWTIYTLQQVTYP